MSAVRAMGASATSATPYAATQAGYDQAIADLTAAGGVIEVSGIDTLVPGTVPTTITVLWFRTDGTLTWYNPILQLVGSSGASMTAQLRSAAQSRIRLGSLTTDFVQLNWNQTDTFFDWSGNLNFRFGFNGTQKLRATGTRWDFATGQDIAFNSQPGTAGQALISAGAAANPVWTTLAGITSGSTSYYWLPAQAFTIDDTGIERLSYRDAGSVDTGYMSMDQFGGASDVFTATTIVVPPRYASTASWKVYLSTKGTSTNPMVVRFGLKVLVDGSTAASAYTVTDNTWNPGGTADILKVLTVTTPGVTLNPGDVVKVMVERRASSDAGDTNADSMCLLGALLTFNT